MRATAALLGAAASIALGQPNGQPIGATIPGVTVWAYDLGEEILRRPVIVEGQTPSVYLVQATVELNESIVGPYGRLSDMFAGVVLGWLVIDEPGLYLFRLSCDDGAALLIDGKPIADTDARRGFEGLGRAQLNPGYHALEVPFYENHGKFHLTLQWRPPGQTDWQPVPTEALRTEAGQTFVTSPGRKKFHFGTDPRRAGDGRPLIGVHPSMTLEDFRGPDFQPAVGGLAFLPDGRLAVSTWDQIGAVYLLDNLWGEQPGGVRVTTFAQGLGEPLGIAVVDGEIYITQKQEVTRLVDEDGDGVADLYEVVASGWPASHNYHEFSFNLVHRDGFFYVTTSVPLRSGSTNYLPGSSPGYSVPGGPGSAIRIDPRTGTWEVIATGLRTPNGMAVGVDGELFCSDNQGSWLPSSKLNHIRPGAFFGHQTEPDGSRAWDRPVVWLPQDDVGNSPSQPALVPAGPYAGQMLVGDVTHGGIKRVFVEKVAGEYQGCVFRFSQGVEAGVNRMVWGPDGALYVGGIGANGNWHHKNKRFGLQRLVPDGQPPFEMLRVEAKTGGLLVTLTKPAPMAQLTNLGQYEVTSWRYEPTEGYGGPPIDSQPMAVDRVSVSADRTRVFLDLPGLAPDTVVYLRLVDMTDDEGDQPWTTECWYTLNALGETARPAFARHD